MKRAILGLVVTVFLGIGTALAKGPADRIVLTTPGGKIIEIADRASLEVLSTGALEVFHVSIRQPEVTWEGYGLERQGKDGETFRTFDRVRYYPAGDDAYVFYVGVENGSSEFDGKWFKANPAAIVVMNALIVGETQAEANNASPLLNEWRRWFAQLENVVVNLLQH